MFQSIRNALKIPELRKKLLFTFFILLIFRLGSRVPVPFVDLEQLKLLQNSTDESFIFGMLNIFSGGAFNYAAIFAMSITPYINASIIMQLLAVAIPALERMQQDGEEGRKKITQITRYVTVVLGLIQGFAYYYWLGHQQTSLLIKFNSAPANIFAAAVIVAAFTAGSALIMWLGEQINVKGIGNGISIILFAGIISRIPTSALTLFNFVKNDVSKNIIPAIGILIGFLALIMLIVFMTDAERRIKIQYAKRVVGRKMYGGQSTHMPIKVNAAGVLPIIFAQSILSIPDMIIGFAGLKSGTLYNVLHFFSYKSTAYIILYLIFIIGFSYFYIAIQYNPVEMANNLKKNNGSIPGVRPGKSTADYFGKILSRLTLIGGIFLAVIAMVPICISLFAPSLTGLSLGGTSLLILVGVALETVKAIESQMLMRHYKGFLD